MVSEKLKLGSDFQIDHSDKTDTFDVLKHFTGIDLEQDRDPRTKLTSRATNCGIKSKNDRISIPAMSSDNQSARILSPWIPEIEKETSSTF